MKSNRINLFFLIIFLFSLSIFLRIEFPGDKPVFIGKNNTIKKSSKNYVKSNFPAYKPYSYQIIKNGGNFFSGQVFFLNAKTGYLPNESTNSLMKYALKSLKYIGYIQNKNTIQALLLCPDGQVEMVKEGDSVGKYHGAVVQVRHDSLRVQEFHEKSRQGQSTISILPFAGYQK